MVYDRASAFEQPLQSELEAQSLAYVLPNELRNTLLAAGLPQEKVPSESNMEELLRSLEIRFDEWLGYRLAPTKYIKERPCQLNGIITVEHYPVLEVLSVQRVVMGWIGSKTNPKPKLETVDALWEGGRNIKVPHWGRDRFRVQYIAGYDPIPPIVKETLLNLLKNFFINYQGDPTLASPSDLLAQLNTLTRDLTQVNLPGGISQTFRVGDPSGGGKGGSGKGTDGGTELDRSLLPLQKLKLRRQTIT